SDGTPCLISTTRFYSPPKPHDSHCNHIGPAARTRRRSPLQRFQLQICANPTALPTLRAPPPHPSNSP
ncbi:hypothetical protein BKA63DRAFT_398830, partial [Paraphoma chrysanthemicola]